ncbi:hypothetical protein ANN_09840 [Periplaneta americana]|uniref:G-protein coupled receptors family 1 profile domain-containing protein n=1 Tax=Periplaneta americana TaxID=6978 RepID=A0ABQ8TP70_PERAM|nr:hypothetical protein ANN_09840 [Periplaneta americana]
MFENKVLRKIFGAKRGEVTGEWRKLHNAELHTLDSSSDIIRNMKSRRLRWAGHVARMGESRNAYRVLVGRPEGKDLWGGRDVDWKSLLAASEADNHSSLTTDKKNASEVGNSGEQYTTLDIFTSHVDPVVYSIYIVVGFLLNGAVIIMFIRSEEIRKPANVMILNLAICDILNIGISGPLQFLCSYEPRYPMMIIGCRTEMAVRQLLRAGAALSLVALSIQRFFITMPSFHRYSSKTSNIYLAVYILAIWLLAMLVSLPTVLVMGVYTYLCSLDVQDPYPTKVMVITNFLFYCALLPLLMFVFSFVTARRLRRSVREFRVHTDYLVLTAQRRERGEVIGVMGRTPEKR